MEGRVKFWSGWIVDGDFLIDPAGNHYHRDEIRAIFFNRQLTRELRGSTLKVRSLKQELERNYFQWPDREVKLAYPYSVLSSFSISFFLEPSSFFLVVWGVPWAFKLSKLFCLKFLHNINYINN